MIEIDSKGTAIDEKEVTAYIQQQVMDLTPHLDEKSAVQVKLKKINDGYEAELTAHYSQGEIQTVGWHEDVYDAIKNAKEGLLQYFAELQDEMNPHLRDEKINYIQRHGNLYLH